MKEKIDFANLICSQDNGLSYPNMTECEKYGMTWVAIKIAQNANKEII